MAALVDNSRAASEASFSWRLQSKASLGRAAEESATACSSVGLQIEIQALRALVEERGLTLCRGWEAQPHRDRMPGSRDHDVAARHTKARQASLRRLRRALFEGDDEEHRETWDSVRRALDEDRFSDRKLFP